MKRLVTSIVLSIVIMLSLATLTLADQPEIVTGQVDLVIYTGQHALGTITLTRDPVTTITEWSFEGTVNGESMLASGTATEVWSDNTARVTLTSVQEWNGPVFRASAGEWANLTSDGNHLYLDRGWGSVAIFVSSPISAPVDGGNFEVEIKGTPFTQVIAKVYPIFQQISTMIRSVFSFILV